MHLLKRAEKFYLQLNSGNFVSRQILANQLFRHICGEFEEEYYVIEVDEDILFVIEEHPKYILQFIQNNADGYFFYLLNQSGDIVDTKIKSLESLGEAFHKLKNGRKRHTAWKPIFEKLIPQNNASQ